MTNNFDLRTFLSENKLTRNAKLLKENFDHDAPQGDSYEEVIDWLDSKYPDASQYDQFVAAFKKEVANLPQEQKEDWIAKFKKDFSTLTENKLTRNAQLLKEQELSYPYGQFGQAVKDIFKYYGPEEISDAPDIVYEQIVELIEEFDLDTMQGEFIDDAMEARLIELHTAAQTMDAEEFGEFAYNELSDGALFMGGDDDDYDDSDEDDLDEAKFSDSYDTPAAKAVNAKANQIVKTITGYKTALQTIQDAIKQVEQEVGSEATRSEKSTLERHLLHMFRSSMEMERESVENKKPVMETKLTARERKLVAIVENALGIAPQAVAEEVPMSEDEMVDEQPLPKYENIEKLMQEIEAGTNEAAHSYKMKRMKEIAEMLEAKVGSLEEGEGADFVDAKKVKQMKKDIMTLRKQAEKLEKEYDKKFAKKEAKKEEE